MQNEILNLKAETESNLKSALITSDDISNVANNKPFLYQNNPNPFNSETEIQFFLPYETSSAILNVYDLSGIQIKSYQLDKRGESSYIITANEFMPGIYLYSLIVEGKLIDTLKMVLTD